MMFVGCCCCLNRFMGPFTKEIHTYIQLMVISVEFMASSYMVVKHDLMALILGIIEDTVTSCSLATVNLGILDMEKVVVELDIVDATIEVETSFKVIKTNSIKY